MPTAAVPKIFDPTLANAVNEVDSEEAYEMIRFIKEQEGYLLSPSAAANLVGAHAVAKQIGSGLIVTVLADTLQRYDEVSKHVFGEVFS